jgi:signal peptidase I
MSSMGLIYDFSLALLVLAAISGLILLVDRLTGGAKRPVGAPMPVAVDYAKSFFPVILFVLVIRAFVFEPFRIPSDSMMPTLLDGDFIFVSKFSYGLRLPVSNVKVVETGSPKRGDVIVFHKPSEPQVNYIKRLIGLPGDRIEVRGDAVWVNGVEMVTRDEGPFVEDACYQNFHQGTEHLDAGDHRVMYCPVEPRRMYRKCTDSRDLSECPVDPTVPAALSADATLAPMGVFYVPPGHYFFMGDNRDNSADSRFAELGFVPEDHLVGKAVRIWASFGAHFMPRWRRIGMPVR